MKSLLDTALCMLDDRHIEEAATYTPQTKTISFKKILPIAVCFVLVIVSAFAVKDYFAPVVTTASHSITTSDGFAAPGDPYTTVAGVIDESTTVANAPEAASSTTIPTTQAPGVTDEITTSHSCPPVYDSWEEAPLYSSSPTITFNGRLYVRPLNSHPLPTDRSKIKGVLTETTVTGYADGYQEVPVTASICEIEGIDSKNAIAVIRNDGLQRGYNIYISKELLYDSTDFNEILEKLDYKNNLILSDYAGRDPSSATNITVYTATDISYYKKNLFNYISKNIFYNYPGATEHFNFEGFEEQAIQESFMTFFEKKNSVKVEYLKGADINEYQYFKEDCLEFRTYLCGYPMEVLFTEEGKLYFFALLNKDVEVICYHFNESDFDYFLANCIDPQPYWPDPGDTVRSVIGNSQTLSDIISFADITTDYVPQNFCTEFQAYYKEDGKEDIIYSISIDTMKKLASLIINNRDAKAEYHYTNTGERLTFNAYLKHYLCEIYLCNDGYLYFCGDLLTRSFNIGVENYEKFLNDFKQSSVVWTPENPVTMG